MTNEELHQAQTLVADMRRILTDLRSAAPDVEKVIPVALENGKRWITCLGGLAKLGLVTVDESFMPLRLDDVFGTVHVVDIVPGSRAKLLDYVAKQVPVVDAELDKIEHAFRDESAS
jgi:hypothetical protein